MGEIDHAVSTDQIYWHSHKPLGLFAKSNIRNQAQAIGSSHRIDERALQKQKLGRVRPSPSFHFFEAQTSLRS